MGNKNEREKGGESVCVVDMVGDNGREALPPVGVTEGVKTLEKLPPPKSPSNAAAAVQEGILGESVEESVGFVVGVL